MNKNNYLTNMEKKSWEQSISVLYRWCCLCISNLSIVFNQMPEGLKGCMKALKVILPLMGNFVLKQTLLTMYENF